MDLQESDIYHEECFMPSVHSSTQMSYGRSMLEPQQVDPHGQKGVSDGREVRNEIRGVKGKTDHTRSLWAIIRTSVMSK